MADYGYTYAEEDTEDYQYHPEERTRSMSLGRKYGLGPLHNNGSFQTSGRTYGTLLSPHSDVSAYRGQHPVRHRK